MHSARTLAYASALSPHSSAIPALPSSCSFPYSVSVSVHSASQLPPAVIAAPIYRQPRGVKFEVRDRQWAQVSRALSRVGIADGSTDEAEFPDERHPPPRKVEMNDLNRGRTFFQICVIKYQTDGAVIVINCARCHAGVIAQFFRRWNQ